MNCVSIGMHGAAGSFADCFAGSLPASLLFPSLIHYPSFINAMSTTPEEQAASDWLAVVRDKVSAMRFGSVQITVHDGRVTQVESNEKTRIAPDRPESQAPGSKPRK